jgi:Fe-S-cluster containining protein
MQVAPAGLPADGCRMPHAPSQDIETFHLAVDDAVAQLRRRVGFRMACRRGCSGCCVDGLTVFEVEAERIRSAFPEVLDEAPHAPGACAFLDAEGACRIYEARPYVCRTQGLPLRWLAEREEDGEIVELRDTCPVHDEAMGIEHLSEDECWTLGPWEQCLAMMAEEQETPGRRVALRSLFTRGG